jgi:hypothetical protein
VAETILSWGEYSTSISAEFKKRIHDIPVPDDAEAGEISGMMEMVNLHNKENQFRLYPIIGLNQITCEFGDALFSTVRAGLGKYVTVSGTMFYKYGEKFPYRIEVTEIEIPADESELPSFGNLRGIAPEITAGVSSELFVRQVRDEWQ